MPTSFGGYTPAFQPNLPTFKPVDFFGKGEDWDRRKLQLEESMRPRATIDQGGPRLQETIADVAHNTSGFNTAAVANTTPAAPSPRQQLSGAGQISDNLTPKPGHFYSDVTPDNIMSLINDPSQAALWWGKDRGFNNAYDKRISSIFNTPELLKAMGVGQGTQLAGTNALDWYGRLWDRLSGRNAPDGNYTYLDPGSIMANVFNTPRAGNGSTPNGLEVSINNPNLQPEQQISNLATYLMTAMKGVIPDDSLNAYAQILDQDATDYMMQVQSTPGGNSSMPTFLEFVRQRHGQYGGMF